MSSPPLSPAVASAVAASRGALRALATLAEALGSPALVPAALEEAKEVLAEAEEALVALEEALVATVGMAATLEVPTPGLEPQELFRKLGAAAEAAAAELERELRRKRRSRRLLRLGRATALVLLLLCAPLLALDVVREALGVTQENHLVPCLAALALVAQVALWASGTSVSHLATALGHQRRQALRYRQRARDAAAAAGAARAATEATAEATAAAGTLEEVLWHLRDLVGAVAQDLETTGGSRGGFPGAARALGDAEVALGTAMAAEDREGTERVARALEALRGDL